MDAGVLVIQGARASAAMVLTYSSHIIPVLAPERSIYTDITVKFNWKYQDADLVKW